MPHTKNTKKSIFDRLGRAPHAHAKRARNKSDAGFGFRVPENPRVLKINSKYPSNQNYQKWSGRAATPEVRGTRTQPPRAPNLTPDSNSAQNSTPETCLTPKTPKNPILTASGARRTRTRS